MRHHVIRDAPEQFFRVLCGDAHSVLQTLEPGSIDVCMTSPPYWRHREYDVAGLGQEKSCSEYVARLCNVLDEVRRVLKAAGSLWLNIGDTYDAKRLTGVPWRVAIELMDNR